jgi:hypothetical protein
MAMGTTSGISSPADHAALPGDPALRWRRVFAGDEIQVREARHWLAELLPKCRARDDVALVATELCNNAVQHTASGRGGFFALEVAWQGATVRISVADAGAPTEPRLTDDLMAERGRGLLVVSELCSRTGQSGDHRGRVVWGDVLWDGPAAPPTAAPGHEAAIRDGLASLADHYHNVPAWFGRSTRQWWALTGRPGAGQLVTARTARELGDRIDSAQAFQRARPLPISDTVAARADSVNLAARVFGPSQTHSSRLPKGMLRLRPC